MSEVKHAEESAIAAAAELIRNYLAEIDAHDAWFGPMELAYLLLDTLDINPITHMVDVPRAYDIWNKWYRNWLRAHDMTAPQVIALSKQRKDNARLER